MLNNDPLPMNTVQKRALADCYSVLDLLQTARYAAEPNSREYEIVDTAICDLIGLPEEA